jgi:hypothetical protein
MRDPNTKEVRGFGFGTMETCEEADAAITALNGTDLFGKPLGVEKARRGRARTPTRMCPPISIPLSDNICLRDLQESDLRFFPNNECQYSWPILWSSEERRASI